MTAKPTICPHWTPKIRKCGANICPYHQGRDGCRLDGNLDLREAKDKVNARQLAIDSVDCQK